MIAAFGCDGGGTADGWSCADDWYHALCLRTVGSGGMCSDEECECSPRCGNRLVEPGERCDDGVGNSDVLADACRTDCTNPRCGDGVVDAGESCDLLSLGANTCRSLGHEAGGRLRCDSACGFDESWCRNPTCGDGTCELGETATGCPADCRGGCGDGTCADAEDQFGCPADCGAVDASVGVADCTRGEGLHACVLLGDGTVRCWGKNSRGQLGDGTTTDSDVPVAVVDLAHAVDVETAGSHSCALLDDGTARCWGANDVGQLGDGTTTDSSVPVAVSGLTGAVAVAVRTGETYFLLADGTVRCWGLVDRASYVTCGPGTDLGTHHTEPVAVPGLTGVVAVAAGGESCHPSGYCASPSYAAVACAILRDGTAWCWGSGPLGDGTTTESLVPVRVSAW